MSDEQELLAIFTAEVSEQLEQIEAIAAAEPGTWDIELFFRLVHNVKGAARMVNATGIKMVAHLFEEVLSVLRDGSLSFDQAVGPAREGARLLRNAYVAFALGEVFNEDEAEKLLEGYEESVGALLEGIEAEAVPAVTPEPSSPRSETPAVVEGAKERTPAGTTDTLRIGIDKLDGLMGLASEFSLSVFERDEILKETKQLRALIQKIVRDTAGSSGDEQLQKLRRSAQHLVDLVSRDEHRGRQLASQLQESIRNLRMVRIDSLKTFFQRVVREACEVTGKRAELQFEGGDTEIDRAVLDGLRDPLVHLLRNSIAHGIETAEGRRAAGKPDTGTLTLRARSAGAWVEIHIIDDGAGVDLDSIRKRAFSKGLITKLEIGDQEALECLFHPGFSTAGTVNELAGRGVGLDVVRSNIHGMGGKAEIRAQPGRGAEFRLQVPLTRLTTRGVLVRLAGQLLAVPVINVERTLRIAPDELTVAESSEVVQVGGQGITVSRLEDVLGLSSDSSIEAVRPGIVIAEGGRRQAYLVDEVLGEAEFTMQGLAANLKHLHVLSGGTVLEGGRVVFVLNPVTLLSTETRKGEGKQVTAAQRSRVRILVADDSLTSRTLERNILQAAGYEVVLAVDGEDAWNKLLEHKFDLLISDVEMPRLTGIELIKRVRGNKQTERLPAILVTSLGNEEHKLAGAQAGANAYIVKGAFDQDELLKAVSRLV